MKIFNWDDHPVVEEQSKTDASASFNWDALPTVEDQPERKLAQDTDTTSSMEVSPLRSTLVGAGQGATLGFAEELTAPIAAAVGVATDLPSESPEESTWEKYKRLMQIYRDTAREEQAAAQEQNPGMYTTGAVGGGLLMPGLGAAKVAQAVKGSGLAVKAAAGAGTGAVYGGLAGAGEAEGELEERLAGAKEGATIGAVAGGVIPAVGATLRSGEKITKQFGELPIISDTMEAFSRGVKGENLVTSAGRREAADIVRQKGGKFYSDIKKLQNDVGNKIQNEIETASKVGTKVNLTDTVKDVLSKLKNIKDEGSQEAASYATSIEKEIKKVLKIKDKPIENLADETSEILVDPKKAQDLKQVLSYYTPKRGMVPQQIESAGAARELRNVIGERLSEVTKQLPELNKQYGLIKDSLKRLKIRETNLPEQIKEQINSVVGKLEKENVSGDNARQIIDDVISNIKQVSPELGEKYSSEFGNIIKRLDLSEKIIKGNQTFGLFGTPRALLTGASNVTGLAAGKLGANKLSPIIDKAIQNTKTFTDTMLGSPIVQKGAIQSQVQGTTGTEMIRQAVEPHKLQRQVASAAESAEPEVLKDQANQIREKHGKAGEQLATILDNMSNLDKSARRAIMFTVLQNQAYRRMLGLINEEETNE